MKSHIQYMLEKAPIIKLKDYEYFISSLTDGVMPIEPGDLLRVAQHIGSKTMYMSQCDKIVTMEAMGIPITTALSYIYYKPYVIVRKRKYGLEGEVAFNQQTGYSENEMFINGLEKGDSVVIVDDVLSTGGTLKGLIPALLDMGVIITDVIVIVNKHPNKAALENELCCNIQSLVDIKIEDGKIVFL